MGNPLSRVLACLFLEFFESSLCKYKVSSNTTYFRYIDDILIFRPQNIKIKETAEKLNNIEPSINFTYEKESNNTILFLDILIIKYQQQDLKQKRLHTFILPPQQQNQNRPQNWLLS